MKVTKLQALILSATFAVIIGAILVLLRRDGESAGESGKSPSRSASTVEDQIEPSVPLADVAAAPLKSSAKDRSAKWDTAAMQELDRRYQQAVLKMKGIERERMQIFAKVPFGQGGTAIYAILPAPDPSGISSFSDMLGSELTPESDKGPIAGEYRQKREDLYKSFTYFPVRNKVIAFYRTRTGKVSGLESFVSDLKNLIVKPDGALRIEESTGFREPQPFSGLARFDYVFEMAGEEIPATQTGKR